MLKNILLSLLLLTHPPTLCYGEDDPDDNTHIPPKSPPPPPAHITGHFSDMVSGKTRLKDGQPKNPLLTRGTTFYWTWTSDRANDQANRQ